MENNSLFLMAAQMSLILTEIIEQNGELGPDLEMLFDNVAHDLQTKTDSYAFLMDKLSAESEFWEKKAEMFLKVSRSCQSLKERLNGSIKVAMRQLNTDEIRGHDIRFKLTASAQKLVLEEDKLPGEYKMVVTAIVPDKERIRHDLGVGIEIPGATFEKSFALRKYVNRKD